MQIPRNGPLRPLPLLIFSSRWLRLPLYLGLIVAQGIYVILFLLALGGRVDYTHRDPLASRQSCL